MADRETSEPPHPHDHVAGAARFRALVEHAPDLLAVLDAEGRTRYASPSHERVLGWPCAELEGAPCLDLAHPDDADELRRALVEAIAADGPVRPRPVRLRHRADGWRTVELILTNLLHDPAVAGVLVNGRDVSEQEALAEQLRSAARMEAMGRLAGGMAHDFNNVLAAIAGYAQLVRADLPADDPGRADLDEILQATTRGSAVTRQLLTFSRRRATAAAVLDLAELVRETGALLRSLLPSSIAIVLDAPAPVWACVDRGGIEQLLMTLAVNARDAMPDGGTLEVVVRERTAADDDAPHGGTALLRVRDTGIGMPAEVRAHLFEPFFTTKPAGTGLGLAAVYGIVRQARGAISVDSAEGEGTTFSVTLPLAAPPEHRREQAAAATATVVLAEDEDAVRVSVQRLLERAGHTVLAVPDGGAALRLLLERDGRADLLLTDATMPVLGGRELARRVAERWPRLPVVLMSGYTEWDEPRGAAGEPASVRAMLEKPFTAERLRTVVAEALS